MIVIFYDKIDVTMVFFLLEAATSGQSVNRILSEVMTQMCLFFLRIG